MIPGIVNLLIFKVNSVIKEVPFVGETSNDPFISSIIPKVKIPVIFEESFYDS